MNRLAPQENYPIVSIREAFPGLNQAVRGKPLVYLDNAATTQVPQAVLDSLGNFHRNNRANIHRAVHELGQRATEAYDAVRQQVANFIGAPSERNIVFVRGTIDFTVIYLYMTTVWRKCDGWQLKS